MTPEPNKIEQILDRYQAYLDSFQDGIAEGAREGIKEGVAKGTKRAAIDVLKQECAAAGVTNISGISIDELAKQISKIALSKDITKTTGDILKEYVGNYLDGLSGGIITELKGNIPSLTALTEQISKRNETVVQQLRKMLPDNPISSAIADGLENAVNREFTNGVKELQKRLQQELQGGAREKPGDGENKAESDSKQVKEAVKSRVKNAVTDVVEKLVYDLVKQLLRRALEKLKQKFKVRLDKKLAKITEQKIERAISKRVNLIQREIARQYANELDFVTGIDKSIGNSFSKYLTHLVTVNVPLITGTALAAAIIITGTIWFWPFESNQAPLAETEFAIQEDGMTVLFNGLSSRDPDGEIESWHWDFGDGSTSENPTPSHTYQRDGDYTVVLTVIDDKGAESSAKTVVNVRLANELPVAQIEYRVEGDGVTYHFSGLSSSDPDGQIQSWHWDFGDGSTSENSVPVHVYKQGGNYTVILTVVDDKKAENSAKTVVNVMLPLEPPAVVGANLPKPTENFFGPFGKAIDGTIYLAAREGTTNSLYKSKGFGAGWTSLAIPANIGSAIQDIAPSTTDPDTFFITDGIEIWKTIDGGANWVILPNLFNALGLKPGAGADGLIISIASGFDGQTSYLFAGTNTFSNGGGNVYYFREGFRVGWSSLGVDTNRKTPWQQGSADVLRVAVDPNFAATGMIMAVAKNNVVGPAGPNTYVTTRIGGVWDDIIPDVILKSSDGKPVTSPTMADIWLPDDFDGVEQGSGPYYVGITSSIASEGDLFSVTNGGPARDLNISGGGTGTSITDVEGAGPANAALLLAGGDTGTGKPVTFFSSNNGFTWSYTRQPPSGDIWTSVARVYLVTHDSFAINKQAMAATGGFDCSISSTSDGGSTWNFTPLDSMDIRIAFSKPMNREITETLLAVDPSINYQVLWENGDRSMIIRPLEPWQPGTAYRIIIKKGASSFDGAELEKDYILNFTT